MPRRVRNQASGLEEFLRLNKGRTGGIDAGGVNDKDSYIDTDGKVNEINVSLSGNNMQLFKGTQSLGFLKNKVQIREPLTNPNPVIDVNYPVANKLTFGKTNSCHNSNFFILRVLHNGDIYEGLCTKKLSSTGLTPTIETKDNKDHLTTKENAVDHYNSWVSGRYRPSFRTGNTNGVYAYIDSTSKPFNQNKSTAGIRNFSKITNSLVNGTTGTNPSSINGKIHDMESGCYLTDNGSMFIDFDLTNGLESEDLVLKHTAAKVIKLYKKIDTQTDLPMVSTSSATIRPNGAIHNGQSESNQGHSKHIFYDVKDLDSPTGHKLAYIGQNRYGECGNGSAVQTKPNNSSGVLDVTISYAMTFVDTTGALNDGLSDDIKYYVKQIFYTSFNTFILTESKEWDNVDASGEPTTSSTRIGHATASLRGKIYAAGFNVNGNLGIGITGTGVGEIDGVAVNIANVIDVPYEKTFKDVTEEWTGQTHGVFNIDVFDANLRTTAMIIKLTSSTADKDRLEKICGYDDAFFQFKSVSTDSNGVKTYTAPTSANSGTLEEVNRPLVLTVRNIKKPSYTHSDPLQFAINFNADDVYISDINLDKSRDLFYFRGNVHNDPNTTGRPNRLYHEFKQHPSLYGSGVNYRTRSGYMVGLKHKTSSNHFINGVMIYNNDTIYYGSHGTRNFLYLGNIGLYSILSKHGITIRTPNYRNTFQIWQHPVTPNNFVGFNQLSNVAVIVEEGLVIANRIYFIVRLSPEKTVGSVKTSAHYGLYGAAINEYNGNLVSHSEDGELTGNDKIVSLDIRSFRFYLIKDFGKVETTV